MALQPTHEQLHEEAAAAASEQSQQDQPTQKSTDAAEEIEQTTHSRSKEEEEESCKSEFQRPKPTKTRSTNALAFWAYLTAATTILTLLFSTLLPLLPLRSDETTWFLSLPHSLRLHYSSGKLIKARHNDQHLHIFAVDRGPKPAETLVLLHGLASSSFSFRHVIPSLASRGLRVLALDLPGSGFSDAPPGGGRHGLLSKVLGVYNDISDKGLFWGFDQLVEKGFVQHDEKVVTLEKDSTDPRYGAEAVAGVVGGVMDELGLGPVHLVLHDSVVGPGMWWAAENTRNVRSLTIIDSSSTSAAFPSWMLGTPVVREVVLGFRPVFRGLLRLCCTRGIEEEAAEAYRMMLKGKGGQWGVVEAGKALNCSFDLGEWAGSEDMKALPLMVLWSHAWTDMWIEEGRRIAAAVPNAKFVQHFGGRWPQEDAAEEIAGRLAEFVLSLPNSHGEVKREPDPVPEHIKTMFNEENEGSSPHKVPGHEHTAEHLQGHDHEHMAGLMDAYGLDGGW